MSEGVGGVIERRTPLNSRNLLGRFRVVDRYGALRVDVASRFYSLETVGGWLEVIGFII